MTRARRTRGGPRTATELHRAWLELVDADGPFLAVPALKRVWPQGIPALIGEPLDQLRDAKPAWEKAWDGWDRHRDDAGALDRYRYQRAVWVDIVLRCVWRWDEDYTTDLRAVAALAGVRAVSPDGAVTVKPSGALVHDDTIAALVLVLDPVDSLRDPGSDGWSASPIDRMSDLLRTAGVQVGVVTDGRWWAIVSARPDTTTASGIVDALTWIEEPATRNAFAALLHRVRLLGGRPEDRLAALFAESVAASWEITEALGVQVRRAVELLVQALSEAALDARGRGEPDPLPAVRSRVYEAAVTTMMRVVFLLFAEERDLLPQGELFTAGYGISSELDSLDARARADGTETLDATAETWHRLLATSQALYRGASFEDLRIPAYGGSLFDPGRFGFLTARGERGTLVITISDRVLLEVLRAVQLARVGGEARRISFRDIDVEQIGYIYEGLLGYSSEQVDEVIVGLVGSAGAEPEAPLAELERLAEANRTPAKLSDAILTWVKREQPAAKPPTKAALVRALTQPVADAERALRAVTPDEALRARLLPFVGVIRRDLRERPYVVQPGGVLVVETPSRATAGAHYTPRSLAEEVVEHALAPLVFEPSPYQGPDAPRRVVSPEQILELKVADIACGSGAFLVAAARYLADRLVEAWRRDRITGNPRELRIRALREVVANCLYGADINAMAVEMCKLSLWLVSLDPKLPFSFVDDKLLHGNSLLGLTSAEQLKAMHIDPARAERQGSLLELDVEDTLRRAIVLRRRLATEVDDADPQRSTATKHRQLRDLHTLTAQLADVADGVIAAGLRLGGKPGRALDEAYANLRIALEASYPAGGGEPDRTMLDGILAGGLTPTVPADYARWQPLHWILAVPDVMERGGFDAIVGNPPFRGGQDLTGDYGTNVRDWLVNVLAHRTRGSADVVAYFFLRALGLLTGQGTVGLIGTNTLGQGATRRVGLDQMIGSGFTITRCVQSMTWPTKGANLEIALCWGTLATVANEFPRVADGTECARISTLLEPAGQLDGDPVRLAENAGIAFQGCIVLGMGFLLESENAQEWLAADSANADVLFPYLNGEDLNSRSDCAASRWVIDFNDRSEQEAKRYALPYEQVRRDVKPERMRNNRAARRERWWQFAERAAGMRRAIADLDEVLVIAQVSRTLMPARVRTEQVFAMMLVVFATDDFADQSVLSSSLHQLWAARHGSTMRTDMRYTPSDVFLTFPRPDPTDDLIGLGKALDSERREIMLRRELGLTKLYNLVNDPDITHASDKDVSRLRQIHADIDVAVLASYGWSDIDPDHGFHTYRRMTRWSIDPQARVEAFDRLLKLNHERAAARGEAPPPAEGEFDEEADE